MDEILTVKDVAAYLKLNERTVLKYASENRLPAVKVGGQWRFKREVLDRWLESKMAATPLEGRPDDRQPLRVASLLRPDLVLADVPAEGRQDVLEAIVSACSGSGQIADGRALLGALTRREELCSTALGQGVAFPHVRENTLRLSEVPVLAMARVPGGVDFGAADGQPTHVFFMVYAPSVKLHLRILARLSRLVRDGSVVPQLIDAPDAEAMLAVIRQAEAVLDSPDAAPPKADAKVGADRQTAMTG